MIKRIALNILKGLNKRTNKPNWKNFRSTVPFSDVFGYDRGNQSVHRYYIDHFVKTHSGQIRGKVLEVGDSQYMDRYSQQIAEQAIIHYQESGLPNSFVGDLTRRDTLPASAFDCFICTQTFNFIYEFHAAIEGAHHLLKPGGYLLATVSGIQQISKFDEQRWGDYWRFTRESCLKSFSRVFGETRVEVTSYGNVLSSVAALEGLTSSELTGEEMDFQDPSYPLILGILARKE